MSDSSDQSHQQREQYEGPIRPGSTLHRALHMVATAIAKRLNSSRDRLPPVFTAKSSGKPASAAKPMRSDS